MILFLCVVMNANSQLNRDRVTSVGLKLVEVNGSECVFCVDLRSVDYLCQQIV